MTSNGIGPDEQGVLVAFKRSEVAYLIDRMLTDEMRTNVANCGAATVVRKIVREAIAAHKKQVTAAKVAAVRAAQ